MTKRKKIIISIVSVFVGMVLLVYMAFGFLSRKSGINGFSVTNGMIYLLVTGKDCVKVKQGGYLYKAGELKNIILQNYDDWWRVDGYYQSIDEVPLGNDSQLSYQGRVAKGEQVYTLCCFTVWSSICQQLFGEKYGATYFKPCEEIR